MNRTIVEMRTTIDGLRTNATDQAATLAGLRTTATDQATALAGAVSAASTSTVLCDGFTIGSDDELELLAPHLRGCTAIRGDLGLQNAGVSNATALAAAFANLRMVSGGISIMRTSLSTLDGVFPVLALVGSSLNIQTNHGLSTLDGVFPSLTTIGPGSALQIWDNSGLRTFGDSFQALVTAPRVTIGFCPILTTLGGSFSALETVGNDLQFIGNPLLTTIGSSFGSLRSVGNLQWKFNGYPESDSSSSSDGSRLFCASAVAALCPTTISYDFGSGIGYGQSYPDNVRDCCNAYCATTPDCCVVTCTGRYTCECV